MKSTKIKLFTVFYIQFTVFVVIGLIPVLRALLFFEQEDVRRDG